MEKSKKGVLVTVVLTLLIFLIICILYFLGYNPTEFVYQRF